MYLNKLYALTSEFPEEAQAVDRLAKFIESRQGRTTQLSINRLHDLANPNSQSALIKIIQRYIELGVFKEVIRVELDGIDELKDYNKLEDVPKVVHDSTRDVDVPVHARDLRLYYTLQN